TKVVEKVITAVPAPTSAPTATPAPARAKYVFVFIGDGMAAAQRNSAELYLAASKSATERPEKTKLVMNTFPAQGMNTTYDLTSVIPDSASTATAISTGYKTKSGVIGMDGDGKVQYETIAEVAKKKGWKVGVLSSVSIDHATPAAFYSHVASRSNMYGIAQQLAKSNFDYFAGGGLLQPKGSKGDQPDVMDAIKTAGYKVVVGRSEFEKLAPGAGKVMVMDERLDNDKAQYYALDQSKTDLSLAELVKKGIDLLDNPTGFIMAVEGGKIDWACHANDAAASIHDTLALDAAVAEAVKFYEKHPKETLVIVTGDHETGGMTIGFAGTKYAAFFDKIKHQKMSYIEFGKKLDAYKKTRTAETAKFEEITPLIK
ncbi:MAG: alkaline phosphatase, partial [Chloroflexota bacterium]